MTGQVEKRSLKRVWKSLVKRAGALHKLARSFREAPPNRVYPPPKREKSSHKWVKWWFFSSKKPRLIPADPPVKAVFPEQAFLCPHPTLEERLWPANVVNFPATYVLEIPLGRTIGARGAVVTDDNVLISDLSMRDTYTATEHFLMRKPQQPPRKLRRLKGTYALLNCVGTTTYHWIYDTLPRFEVLRRAGYDMEAFDGFFLRHPKYQPHYKTLELLGIPTEKIVWCTQNSHYGCDRLVVPSFTTDDCADPQKHHHPWVFPFLRKLGPPSTTGPKRRLLINRRDSLSTARQIVNQAELTVLLEKYGFEEITLGCLDFPEQARLFASAEFIVAAHGGGLSNLCFCEAGTRLLELFAPDYVQTHFRNIARQLDLEYQPLVMEAIANPLEPTFGGNIRVDLRQIEKTVQTMLAAKRTPSLDGVVEYQGATGSLP